jgi:hypothetical protein
MKHCALLLIVICCGGVPLAAREFRITAEKTHTERITESRREYLIHMDGRVDMDNSMTRLHGTWEIAFQNNLSLTIANTGGIPVENPRVIINDRGRWHSWQAMLEEFTRDAETDQDRIFLIWEGLRQNRHHDYPLFADDEYHDPVRLLNIYGGGFCDDAGKCGSALYHCAGFNIKNGGEDPFVRALHGHMMCEVWHDGGYQFMDIDQDTFYFDRYNRKPVSGDTVARDHDLAKREQAYGPAFTDWNGGPHSAAALFGSDDSRSPHGVWGHEMHYTLRPGEKYIFRWDNIGKYPWQRQDIEHRYYGNSKIVYEPRLIAEAPAFAPLECEGFAVRENMLTVTGEKAVLAINNATPWTFCGGAVYAAWTGLPAGGRLALELAARGGGYREVHVFNGGGAGGGETVVLDEALKIAGGPPCRQYAIRLTARDAAGLRLHTLRIESDIYAYPIALPRLRCGVNHVEYSDDTALPHEITVTHAWREAEATPPKPPMAPHRPMHANTISETFVRFRWPAVPGVRHWHLRVSADPEMRWPWRPNYDVYLEAPDYTVPYRGQFVHGGTYYWQVRPCYANGLWGAWSPRWQFTVACPMPPRNLRAEQADGNIVLHWDAPALSAPVAEYHVYGSDERGFSVNPDAHTLPVRGEVPGNLFGVTSETGMIVAGPGAPEHENANRAFYRVVAVTAAGVESGPSGQAELSRPWIYNHAMPEAKAGQPYEYTLNSISSIGDLQSRYIDPRQAYREKEAYRFELTGAPEWLRIDPETGLLSGTPPADTPAGLCEFRAHITTSYPDEVPPDSKSGRDFQKDAAQFQRECSQSLTLKIAP